jgi:hypothetical protein
MSDGLRYTNQSDLDSNKSAGALLFWYSNDTFIPLGECLRLHRHLAALFVSVPHSSPLASFKSGLSKEDRFFLGLNPQERNDER